MEARAILRYARISPRKVSIVMDQIRNKPLAEALAILQYTPLQPQLRKTPSIWTRTTSTSPSAMSAPARR